MIEEYTRPAEMADPAEEDTVYETEKDTMFDEYVKFLPSSCIWKERTLPWSPGSRTIWARIPWTFSSC